MLRKKQKSRVRNTSEENSVKARDSACSQDSGKPESNADLDSKNPPQESEACNDLQAEIAKKDAQIQELEERYMRTYAEFENVKKRLEREKYQSLEYANEAIIKDLLPILDTLESALSANEANSSEEVVKNIQDGIVLTLDKFLSTLAKYGLEVVDSSGEFDPNVHNAIMQVKDESKENGQIAQVLQKGYKYKERVVRPSMVSIVKNN